MIVLGRRVIETTLDDIPRSFRAVPGYIAMNRTEIDAFRRGDAETFKRIVGIISAEDMADALLQTQKRPKRLARTSPGTRMAMLRVVDPGRPDRKREA